MIEVTLCNAEMTSEQEADSDDYYEDLQRHGDTIKSHLLAMWAPTPAVRGQLHQQPQQRQPSMAEASRR